MVKCYRCERSDSEVFLYEAISPGGRVFVCEDCYSKFKMPLIERRKVDWEKLDSREGVKDRLSRMAHLSESSKVGNNNVEHFEDGNLREIIEKNFEKNKINDSFPDDVFRNFHWAIIRKRRSLRITQNDLSKRTAIPLKVIQSIEKGQLSKEYKILLRKIENALGIYLLKERPKEIETDDILEEAKNPRGILLSDLRKSYKFWSFFKRKKKEVQPEEDLEKDSSFTEEIEDEREKETEDKFLKKESKREKGYDPIEEKEDLSESDIQDIIWGRK